MFPTDLILGDAVGGASFALIYFPVSRALAVTPLHEVRHCFVFEETSPPKKDIMSAGALYSRPFYLADRVTIDFELK